MSNIGRVETASVAAGNQRAAKDKPVASWVSVSARPIIDTVSMVFIGNHLV